MKGEDNSLASCGQNIAIIPLYPYEDGVILPTSDVPIHFIVREDIEMMEYIQMRGKTFGMVLSDDGCLVDVGLQRFRIIEILKDHKHPFILAKVNLSVSDRITESLEELHQLQREVYSSLQEVLHLTNYNSGINGSLTDAVIKFAPRIVLDASADATNVFYNMTSFSFAVAEMVTVHTEDRQQMLEYASLSQRFRHLQTLLQGTKSFLLGTLFEETMPTISCEENGYYVWNQKRQVFIVSNLQQPVADDK
eukprot:gene29998-39180_t